MRGLSILLPSLAAGFTIHSRHPIRCERRHGAAPRLASAADDSEGDDDASAPQGLILDASAVAQQMAGLKSKYPTAEADYLAAARARAAARAESVNSAATDEDWKQAKAAARTGEDDDWEVFAKNEAGNIDSQILIPLASEEEDEEPKLMLF